MTRLTLLIETHTLLFKRHELRLGNDEASPSLSKRMMSSATGRPQKPIPTSKHIIEKGFSTHSPSSPRFHLGAKVCQCLRYPVRTIEPSRFSLLTGDCFRLNMQARQ